MESFFPDTPAAWQIIFHQLGRISTAEIATRSLSTCDFSGTAIAEIMNGGSACWPAEEGRNWTQAAQSWCNRINAVAVSSESQAR